MTSFKQAFGAMASLAIFAAIPCYAMPAGNPPVHAPQPSSTVDKGSTQGDMNRDADNDFIKADRELNRAYLAVLKKHAGDTTFIAKFKTAQRAWLVFRDAEIAAHFPDADPRLAYGSVYPMCASNLKTELTLKRIEQLKQWQDGTPEGDICAGSVPINGDAD